VFTTSQRLCPRTGEVASELLDGTAIIMHVGTGRCYTTNNVGALIWEMIDGRHSVEEIVPAIVENYDVARDQASRDVVHFAAELCRRNLISTAETAAANSQHGLLRSCPKQSYQPPILNIR
jgi:hypothetical protein